MRYTRIVASIVFSVALVFILCFNTFAAGAETQPIDVYMLEAEYRGLNFSYFYPSVVDDDSVSFRDIPNAYNDDYNNLLTSLTLVGFGMNDQIDFQHGYIYTFNYHVRITGVYAPDIDPIVSLGIAELNYNDEITMSIPIGDVTYQKITVNQRVTDFLVTSVVYVDDSFNNAGIDIDSAAIILTFSNMFLESAPRLNIYSSDMTVEKAVGEDAYYQASLDAITALPNEMVDSEYSFVLNRMPDEDGQIEQITGDLDDMLLETRNELNGFNILMNNINTAEPMVYVGNMNIPMGEGVNIDLTSKMSQYVTADGFFNPLSMLNRMNPNIHRWIDVAVAFIRFIAIMTFLSVGIFKMSRIEWWL